MLKIKKFNVKNYKSIQDSGDCYVEDGITILAGKNESGKTSLLEALEDFDTENKIREEAKSIKTPDLKPKIAVTFEIDKKKLSEIHKDFLPENKNMLISILKDFENKYSLENSNEFFSKNIHLNEKKIRELQKNFIQLKKIASKHEINLGELRDLEFNLEVINEDHRQNLITQLNLLKKNIEKEYSNIPYEENKKVVELTSKILEIINNYLSQEKLEEEFLEEFKKYIPNFILFDTYNDNIPNNVPLNKIKEDSFVKDLVEISDLNLDIIQNTENVQDNLEHQDKVNLEFSREYGRFWEQDAANLFFNWDKETLQFWIKEDGKYYKPTQRSKGRQWHLSFYARVTARSKENVPNIILIDEPGLFLHAKAQKDILKKLEESSAEIPIIFSTHSPYLIDSSKLNRVRLVEKDNSKGTKISKVHAKADKETLTPILTAIGEDSSQGIRADIKNSFIVEGISDYYYLIAFKRLMNFDRDVNFVPGCGDNIPAIASILFGWSLEPYFILDSDKPKLKQKLNKKLGIEEEKIITILEEKGAIEDIFSNDDFKKFVLENYSAEIPEGKTKYLKSMKLNKELLSRNFLNKINRGEIKKENLSSSTKRNIENLFGKISNLLK